MQYAPVVYVPAPPGAYLSTLPRRKLRICICAMYTPELTWNKSRSLFKGSTNVVRKSLPTTEVYAFNGIGLSSKYVPAATLIVVPA